MGLSRAALDEFVARGLWDLTSCDAESLAGEFHDREEWLKQFVLRWIFQNHVKTERAALAFVLLRLADAALDEWGLACAAGATIRGPSPYFKALRHFEACVAATWQALTFTREALGSKLFETNDGSVYQRLNWIYNKGRHFDPNALPSGDLHAVWITKEGIHTHEHSVTFVESREVVAMVARIARRIATGPETDDQ